MRHFTIFFHLIDRRNSYPHPLVVPASVALLLGLWVAPSSAQAALRDVGTMRASGQVIWVRATNAGRVELFISQGYRDALARPSVLDATRLTAWVDTASALQRPTAGLVETRLGAPGNSSLVLDRWLAADSAGLRIQRDGAMAIRLNDASARQLVSLLTEASRVSRALSAQTVAADPGLTSTNEPATAQATVAARVAPPRPRPTRPAPAPAPAPKPVPVPVAVPVRDMVPSLPVRTPRLQPSLDHTIPKAAPGMTASLSSARTPVPPGRLAAEPVPALALADKHIQTPLGPFVVPGAKLRDHDTQINYCYTELGLRYDHRLTGNVTVQVTLSGTGVPDTVEVTKRTWDGVAAAEVESCMRALIEDWSFAGDAGGQPRVIALQFVLAPSTGMRLVAARRPDAEPADVARPR